MVWKGLRLRSVSRLRRYRGGVVQDYPETEM